jgi:predicted nucleotidyltransferase
MMLNRDLISETLRQYKPILREKYFVSKIGFFGSFARDEQRDESDLDILVEFNQPVGFEFIDLKYKLEDIFKIKIDLVTPEALKPQIKENILKEVIYQ